MIDRHDIEIIRISKSAGIDLGKMKDMPLRTYYLIMEQMMSDRYGTKESKIL